MSRLPEPIGDAVRSELARFGPAGVMADLVAAWPELVGPAIAQNAWPARVARDGTLHVHTSSSSWGFELTQLAPTILERLRARLAEQTPVKLRFAPGPLPAHGVETAPSSSRNTRNPVPAELAEGARIAAPIEDPDLRAAVARAAAASLARAASGRAF